MATENIDLKTAVFAALVILAVEVGIIWAINPDAFYPIAILGTARFLEIMLLLALIRLSCEQGLASIGLEANNIPIGLKKGALWSAGFGGLVALVFAGIFFSVNINPFDLIRTGLPASTGEIFLFFLIGGMVSPVAEEIFFRGIFYGFLRQWGVWLAVLLSTLVFVLSHATGEQLPIPQIIGGIVFALAYEREQNLVVPMVIHILGNLAIFSIALF